MAEERFTSQYDGTTQDNLLKFAENVKKATTVDGAETVNVQGFTLPRISDISGFVAVNNALGELMNIDSSSFCFRGGINTDVTDVTKSGLYIVDINSPNNPFPGYYSIACAFVSVNQSYKVIIACRNLPSSVKMWYKFESSNISGWFNIY